MATKKKLPSVEEVRAKIIHVTKEGDEFRVTVPGDAKITFGPAFPPVKEKGYNVGRQMEYALRVYRGTKENLIAVFTGVREFRESGITYEKKIVAEAGKTLWRSDEEGFKVSTSVKRKEKFMDTKLIEGDLAENADDLNGL